MKIQKIVFPAAVASAAALVFGLVVAGSAQAAPPTTADTGSYVGPKVTICHNTAATTNPYRRITVDIDSIMHDDGHGDNGSNRGQHNEYSHSPVFDPDFEYPANDKKWQDIIPPFSYTHNGVAGTYPGLNYSGRGKEVYDNGCDGYYDPTDTTEGGGGSTTTTTTPLPRNGVRVTVYVDLNNNCMQDDDEPTVPAVDVDVTKNSTTYGVTTGSDGKVVKGPIPAGSYNGEVTSELTDLEVTCTDEDTTDVPGNGIGDIKIGIRGNKDIEIDVTPPDGDPDPDEIIIHYCGQDEICDNDDDFEFPATKDPDGKFNVSGLPGGKYYVRPMGTGNRLYKPSTPINLTTSGQNLSVEAEIDYAAEATLALTGSGDVDARALSLLMMVLAGGALLFVSRRRTA